MVNKDWYEWKSGNLLLRLQVQTRASVNKFAEIKENRIKLRIKAAAVNGKANDAIIKFFSKEFRVPKSSVEILRGGKSTKKLVSIHSPGQLPELPGLQRNGLK
ncbi:MAG TPA: YggU family protein [Gammaproteobacteria bacterium]|nr:YggU family protein [Gammaproteobacteria bacterium]